MTELLDKREGLEEAAQEEINIEKRIEHFRKVLQTNAILSTFDRNVFESVVDKVIIGESLNEGNPNPYKLTFIYKTGFTSSVQARWAGKIEKKPQ